MEDRMFIRAHHKSRYLFTALAGLLAALEVIAAGAQPTEAEVLRGWQIRADEIRQEALKDPSKPDWIGNRIPVTYTKVSITLCQPRSESETFCFCDVWYTKEGKQKKDSGGITMVRSRGQWVMKRN